MRISKKSAVVVLVGALMALGSSSAFAERGNGGGGGDDEGDNGGDVECSLDQENDSDNTIRNSDGGLLGLVGLNLGLQGNNISIGDRLLCGVEILNDVNVLGGDDDHDGDDGDDVDCSVDQDNESNNTIRNSDQDGGLLGLVGLNLGLQGNNISIGDRLLCGVEILNDVNVLSGDDGDSLLSLLLGDDDLDLLGF